MTVLCRKINRPSHFASGDWWCL